MGCGSSQSQQPTNAHRIRNNPIIFFDGTEEEDLQPIEIPISEQLRNDSSSLLQGISHIKAPNGLIPLVVLSDNSFPLFVSSFSFEFQKDLYIMLPVAAVSRHGDGRFLFFGSQEILNRKYLENTENFAFFDNLMAWGSCGKMNIRIWLDNLDKYSTQFRHYLSSLGYSVDAFSPNNSRPSDILFITSTFLQPDLVFDFAKKGGTVLIFGARGREQDLNIYEADICFTVCSLQTQDTILEREPTEFLEKFCFPALLERFKELINKPETNFSDPEQLQDLDDSVSQLRYYISEVMEDQEECYDLFKTVWSFMEKTGAFDNYSKLCPKDYHCILAVLLSQLIPKLSHIPPFKGFPGDFSSELEQITLNIDIQPKRWERTGLYLPKGSSCTVLSSSDCIIQIGCHIKNLLSRPAPYPRWPTITKQIHLFNKTETVIDSPFGGIIYLISDRSIRMQISFSHITKYPIFSMIDPSLWNSTKAFKAPWGELEGKNLTISMPHQSLFRIHNHASFIECLDTILLKSFQFLNIEKPRSIRLIFDLVDSESIEVSHDMAVIVSGIDKIDSFIDGVEKGNDIGLIEVVQIISQIVMAPLTGRMFDSQLEEVISKFTVVEACDTKWPECHDIINNLFFTNEATRRLFDALRSTKEQHGIKVIRSATVGVLSNKQLKNADDVWGCFMSCAVSTAGTELPKLACRYSSLGALSMTFSDRLTEFQVEEQDLA